MAKTKDKSKANIITKIKQNELKPHNINKTTRCLFKMQRSLTKPVRLKNNKPCHVNLFEKDN